MLRNLVLKTVRDQGRSLLWWGTGLAALCLVTVLFYPSIRSATGLDEMLKQIPEALLKAFVGDAMDFTSPQGYLNSQLYQMMLPLLLLVYAIRLGSDATAGEEERGTMDLLLACPLPRRRLVMQKAVAIGACTAAVAGITWAGIWVGIEAVDMNIEVLRVAEASLSALLLALVFGMLALAVGAASGKKALANGIAAAVAVATYFLNALASLVEKLASFRKFSPFYQYIGGDPLTNGLNLAHAGMLAGLAAALFLVALFAFERRDVGT